MIPLSCGDILSPLHLGGDILSPLHLGGDILSPLHLGVAILATLHSPKEYSPHGATYDKALAYAFIPRWDTD
jgi:hypothetical protein